ncbi:MAG: CoA-binding protein, partial [Acetobacteraceae bacterium]|nr:CoA-binding protein [Acetobacteraceae bacterium]
MAVIGASRSPGKIGHTILKNLIGSGFSGPIYPINPNVAEIEGRACYPDLSRVPGPVELAVVSVPAGLVLEVAESCGQAGVRALVVITAGFREVGQEGLAREKQLVEICRRYGMIALGPNCLGLVDTYTPLNVCFAPMAPLKGDIAFISQSGAFCIAILDWALEANIGFSKFVSLGNKADISEIDLIEALAADDQTKVILGYLEGVADGNRFMAVAKEVVLKKP